MGVTLNVNSPADQTNTENNLTQNTLKLYPIDFTHPKRKLNSFKLVSSVRDIMNAINGPKIMELNISQSNDINTIWNNARSLGWLESTAINSTSPEKYGVTSGSNTLKPALRYKGKLYVRRIGENANAISAVTYMTENYDQQAAHITNNAPSDSMYSYPFVFSNYTIDPAIRPLNIDPILRWYWSDYVLPTTVPDLQVLKINTLNTNIRNGTNFPSSTTPFPSNALVLDLSKVNNSADIGKIYKLTPYVIDVSNTYEGPFPAVASTRFDSTIAQVLDRSLPRQDIEFGLFLASMWLTTSPYSGNLSPYLATYKYDPVEGVFSYFSTKKYEFTDYPLYNMTVNSSFKNNIIYSNRIALTYLMQQAAKMMKIWLNPSQVLADGSYTSSEIDSALCLNFDYNTTPVTGITYVSSNTYYFWPQWVPYEYVKSSNNNIELDSTTWVSGRGNRKVAKFAIKPRSYTESNTGVIYYNKYGQAFNYNCTSTARPTSIYVSNLPDRCIYTSQTWNENNLLQDDYLEESDYFPSVSLETNI